jgi:hypothetical protein
VSSVSTTRSLVWLGVDTCRDVLTWRVIATS